MEILTHEGAQNIYSTVKLEVPATVTLLEKDEETITSKIDNGSVGLERLRMSSGWVLNLEVCVT